MKLTAKLVNTFKHEKIGKAVAVEGIAIMEGTYKGLDGKTIYYPFDAIVRSSGRLKGKPILYAHTWKGEEVKYVSAGFISETWLGDKIFKKLRRWLKKSQSILCPRLKLGVT